MPFSRTLINYIIHFLLKQSMASATLSSLYSPVETCSSNNIRDDDSFSSYLALVRQSFCNELASSAVPNPSSRRSSFQTVLPPKGTSRVDNGGELDVFGAEKYFSGTLDVRDYPELLTSEYTRKSSNKKKSAASKSRSSTCSETSVNSQSILLGNSRRHHQKQQPPPPSSAPRRRGFLHHAFSCSCSKKNAVKVEDDADNSWNRRNNTKLPPSCRKSPSVLYSESSSELFEIDSFSMNSQPVYEPSEASIEWSIATASAGNLSVAEKASAEGKVRRCPGLLTFGCVSEKAVSVTGDMVGSPDRYHVMMDLQSARPRRATSLGGGAS